MWISGDSFIFPPRKRGVDLSNWQGWSLLLKYWFPTPPGNLAPDKHSWKLLGCACIFQGPLKWKHLITADPLHAVRSTSTPHGEPSEVLCRDFSKHGEQTFVPHPAFSSLCIQTAREDVLKAVTVARATRDWSFTLEKPNGSPWGLESVIGDSCLGGRGGCFVFIISTMCSQLQRVKL